MSDLSSGERRDIESMIPKDQKCREDMTNLLQELDIKVAAQVEELAAHEPSVVDPLDTKLDFVRKASDLAGQRKMLKGLVRILGSDLPEA